ncbi:hypothetical protein [Ideonella sp. BN130291]|uniref:hypothetical protein n=1 Tax=Ideonella sp. BN130291 TaxID=3112940 RepID=UPI002E25B051|nr:hypothetical protein [Ideonella sp. BN130291]
MGLMDTLQQYAVRATDTHTDFDEVARQVPPDVLGAGVAHAFRADQTPPFGQMLGQLFGNSGPQLRAGVLNQLIRTVGPAVLSNLAGGVLGRLGQGAGGSAPPNITPEDAARITPEQVHEIAQEAEKKDPGVMDKIGSVYAQHPEVVKVLGGAALAVALGHMAQRMNR